MDTGRRRSQRNLLKAGQEQIVPNRPEQEPNTALSYISACALVMASDAR